LRQAGIRRAFDSSAAAAATADTVKFTSARPPPVPFRADHPFLFYLTDDTTGAILFQGRVADPRG
jgi:serpin B